MKSPQSGACCVCAAGPIIAARDEMKAAVVAWRRAAGERTLIRLAKDAPLKSLASGIRAARVEQVLPLPTLEKE